MPYWEPAGDLVGRTVAILAGGPSLLEAPLDLLRERGVALIAINNSFRLAPDAWALIAADMGWWLATPEARHFAGHKVCLQPGASDPWMCAYPVRDPLPGRNSALHAAYVARDAGAARILLFGVDLRQDERTHWHGEHTAPLRQIRADDFTFACEAWARLAARGDRPPILNCSPRSALKCFPFADPVEELSRK